MVAINSRAHSIPVDEIIRTDREHEEWLAEQAQQPDPLAVAQEAANALKEQELAMRDKELSAKLAISEKEWDTRELMATMQFDGNMDQAVAKLNAMRDKMGQDATKTDREIQHKERGLAAEIAMAQQTGVSSGGAV